jgi:hypothetical protein
MTTRIPIRLDQKTHDALLALAEHEHRDTRSQAEVIIIGALKQLGYLKIVAEIQQANNDAAPAVSK